MNVSTQNCYGKKEKNAKFVEVRIILNKAVKKYQHFENESIPNCIRTNNLTSLNPYHKISKKSE